MPVTFDKDFRTDHLTTNDQREVAKIVMDTLAKPFRRGNHVVSGGGCTAFRTPERHAEMGESYGDGATLLLIHDGGDLAPWINYDYGKYQLCEMLDEALRSAGYLLEQCTSWFARVTKQ